MRTKTSLIMQDGVMIPQTETPVLSLDFLTKGPVLELLSVTVRLLRCGCPSVQWLVTTIPGHEDYQATFLNWVLDALTNLQSGDDFKVVVPAGEWKQGYVYTITRIVPLPKEETTFGKLERGDEFFTRTWGPETKIRFMKIPLSPSGYNAVALTGERKGLYFSFPDHEPVLKIVE